MPFIFLRALIVSRDAFHQKEGSTNSRFCNGTKHRATLHGMKTIIMIRPTH
jgi:hypothetical protein